MEEEPAAQPQATSLIDAAADQQATGPSNNAVVDVDAPGTEGNPNEGRARSRTRSSSGSSSSRSPASSSRSKSGSVPKFVIDDSVEVFGLESDGGKFLNGRKGVVVQFIEEHGRYEVSFGPERLATVRPENLRRCEADFPKASAPKPEPKAEQPKADSLASLLGFGRAEPKAEAPKPEQWTPVWQRSGSTQPAGTLNEEQQDLFRQMQAEEQQLRDDDAKLRRRVETEFAEAGVFEEAMIEQAFQEQRQQRDLRRLQRGRSRSRSRSRSRGRSRGRSRSGGGSSSSSSSCSPEPP